MQVTMRMSTRQHRERKVSREIEIARTAGWLDCRVGREIRLGRIGRVRPTRTAEVLGIGGERRQDMFLERHSPMGLVSRETKFNIEYMYPRNLHY